MNSRLSLAVAVIAILAMFWAAKQLLIRFIAKKLVKKSLTAIGQRALSRTPIQVRLGRVDAPVWHHAAAVEQQATPLLNEGFQDVGTYNVDRMPGYLIRVLHHPQTYVTAHIYDHPQKDSWVEFVSRYTDGSSHTLSTNEATGLNPCPWVRTIRADKNTPTDQLYFQFKRERDWQNIKPVAADQVIKEFEDAFLRYMRWREEAGLAPEEVARVAVKWAQKRGGRGVKIPL